MRIDIITVLPEMIEGFFNCSIMKRAQNKGLAEIHIHNLRDYTEDKYRRVDDYPFGGFAGNFVSARSAETSSLCCPAACGMMEPRKYSQ